MEERPQPRLSLKVGFFLSDTTVPDCGAMKICPRSHLAGAPPPPTAATPAAAPQRADPPGAIDVRVKPGTAVLFDRRLWHARGYNYSQITRKVIFIGYSYRCECPLPPFACRRRLSPAL
jgi:ectoine hydroxylase